MSLFPIDTHAHLSYLEARGLPLPGVFRAWKEAGGGLILDIGTEAGDLARRKRAISLALEEAGIQLSAGFPAAGREGEDGRFRIGFSAGIWPSGEAVRNPDAHLPLLIEDLKDDSVLALGECGLDYHWLPDMRKEQIALFEAQIALADSAGMPLVVHSREAFDDTLAVLKSRPPSRRGVIHCFCYGEEEAKSFIDIGFLISFAGNLTYGKAENLKRAVRALPLDMILAETDAPYLAPMPKRGKASSPLDAALTIRCMAELLGLDEGELGLRLAENAEKLFRR